MDIKRGWYKHYKGNFYLVKGIALHTETQEKMIVYWDSDHKQMFVRPYKMFFENIEIGGVYIPRFQYEGEVIYQEVKI